MVKSSIPRAVGAEHPGDDVAGSCVDGVLGTEVLGRGEVFSGGGVWGGGGVFGGGGV